MPKPSYQLTKYPVGSLGEIWTISWPLILSMLSMSIMLFTDRIMLSRYSVLDLNAAASACTASWTFMVLPVCIAAITEVFVGRYHGEGRHGELGKPVWQMLWFTLLLTPLYWALAYLLPDIIFSGSPNLEKESIYFSIILYFSPALFSNVAIAGFFIGSGKVRIVTISSILGNVINISLDYLLIYGNDFIEPMGIRGAAIATGIAEIFQFLFILILFLGKEYRVKYGTGNWSFNKSLFIDSLKVGFPAGLGITVEVFSHFVFFRIIALAGQEALAVAAFVQTLFFLVFFLYEGLSKGVSTLCANLLGAKQYSLVGSVLRSALALQTLFFAMVGVGFYFFFDAAIDSFLDEKEVNTIFSSAFRSQVQWGCVWMTLFFLFDGYTRVLAGQLTASGDTKFLLYAGTALNLVGYIAPVSIVVLFMGGGAVEAWMIVFFYSIANCLVYTSRYLSNNWQTCSEHLQQDMRAAA